MTDTAAMGDRGGGNGGGGGGKGWRQSKGWRQPGPYGGQQKGRGDWHQSQGWNQQSGGRNGWNKWPSGGSTARASSSWQGLQDAAGAARAVLETVRDVRALAAPAPARPEEPQAAQGSWLNTARSWLLGGAEPAPAVQPAKPAGKTEGSGSKQPGCEELLTRLLGAPPPDRQQASSAPDVLARPEARLAQHDKLRGALVDRVAQAPTQPTPPKPAEAAGQQPAADTALRDQLVAQKVRERLAQAAVQPAELPLLPAIPQAHGQMGRRQEEVTTPRAPTPLKPGEEVTPDQHETFWAYLDDVPRAPWGTPGSYEGWVQKMTYKCKVDDLKGWMLAKGLELHADEGQPAPSRRAMLDALVQAGSAEAPGGSEGGTPARAQ